MLDHSRLEALCAVPTLMLVMAWVTVMLRCWVKKRMLNTFTLDDWFMLLSLAIFTGMVGLQYRKSSVALGQHMTELSLDQVSDFFHLFFVGQIVYILLTVFIKISISIFLLRISLERVHRLIIYATVFVYVSTSIYFIISIVIQCSPVAYFWDKTIPGGSCEGVNQDIATALASAALTTSTDLVYSLLPLWLIRNLQMDLKSKVSVAVILSMGLLSTAATCIRFKYIVPLNYSTDFTYDVFSIEIWSTIEPGLGITAASAATLRPLLRALAARVGLGSKHHQHRHPSTAQALQISSNPKCASPTSCAGIRGHMRSLSGRREVGFGPGGLPSSASLTKLVLEETRSSVEDVESCPRTRRRSVVLEHGWPLGEGRSDGGGGGG